MQKLSVMKYLLMGFLLCVLIAGGFAQEGRVSGSVNELNIQGDPVPLQFVNVYWSGTSHGTITNEEGEFSLSRTVSGNHALVFSFVGYANDTIPVPLDQTELRTIQVTESGHLTVVRRRYCDRKATPRRIRQSEVQHPSARRVGHVAFRTASQRDGCLGREEPAGALQIATRVQLAGLFCRRSSPGARIRRLD